MRKNFGPQTWLYPMPVLIIGTYDDDGTPNAMNAAWGGICGENRIMFELGSHRTTDNILRTRAFTVAAGTAEYVTECDYVGVVSGRDVKDKLARAGFTSVKSEFVNAPVINELPLTLECELDGEPENGRFTGKILNVSADEKFLGGDGMPDLSKFTPIIFDPVTDNYVAFGSVAGKAFSDGKKLK